MADRISTLMQDMRPAIRSPASFAAIYGALALAISTAHVFLAPPFQSPDEENHFLRSVQLMQGSVVGHRTSDGSNAGAKLPAAAVSLVDRFRYMAGRPSVHVDGPALAKARAVRWDWNDKQFAGFGNTVIYPPFLYMPAVAGVWIASAISPFALDALYAARLFSAITAVLAATLAVFICAPRERAAVACILLLPMTLALFGSCTPDGLAIALTAVVVSIWSKQDGELSPSCRIAGTAIIAVVSSTKLPYLPLLAVALLRWPGGRINWRVLGASAVVAFLPLVVAVRLASAGKVEFRASMGVSSLGQLRFVLEHPLQFLVTIARTTSSSWWMYTEQAIGVLGWLDTSLPRSAYHLYAAALLLAYLPVLIAAVAPGPPWRDRSIVLSALLFTVAGVFLTLYLNWTPVGAVVIDGVQGRYFLVPLLFLTLMSGACSPCGPACERALGMIQFLVLLIGNLGLWLIPWTILVRYYA